MRKSKTLLARWVVTLITALVPAVSNAGQPAADPTMARIEGAVLENGKPVAGAEIRVLTFRGSRIPVGKSDANGVFRLVLDSPVLGYATLHASTQDGTLQGLVRSLGRDTHASVAMEITLKPSRAVHIHVVDEQKKPVAAASVGVFDGYFLLSAAESDERGMVSCRIPADAQVWWIMGLKSGVGFDYFENYKTWSGQPGTLPPDEVTLTLDGARSVPIRVMDAARKPLPGQGVLPLVIHKNGKINFANLSGAEHLPHCVARADQQGVARFDWLPSQLKNGVSFQASAGNHEILNFVRFDPLQPTRTLTALLGPGGNISGKITGPDGRPMAGVLIEAGSGGASGQARSDVDGKYRMPVQAGLTYRLAVVDDDWTSPSRWIVANRSRSPANVDFQLTPGTLVHGIVTSGKDKKPFVGDLVVQELQSSRELTRWVKTDSKGAYHVRLPPGEYRIGIGLRATELTSVEVGSSKAQETNVHVATGS
jgi:hypothetical protein